MIDTTAREPRLLLKQLAAVIEGEPDRVANLANCAALLFDYLDDVNWVGFYIAKQNQLVLGPFQGKPACVRIPWGKGVCGTAAASGAVQRVDDVTAFPGHIACDAASASEVVAPIVVDDQTVAVLDVDSPLRGRFSGEDALFLAEAAAIVAERWGAMRD